MNHLLPNTPVLKVDAPNLAWAQGSSLPPQTPTDDIYQTVGWIFNQYGWMVTGNRINKKKKLFLEQNRTAFSFLQEISRVHFTRAVLSRTPAARFPLSSPATHSSARILPWGLCLRDWRLKLVPTRMLSPHFGAGTCPPIILVTRKIRHRNQSVGASLRAQGFAQIFLLVSETLAQGRQQSGKCQSVGDQGSGLKEGEGWRVSSIFRLTEVKEFF